ncbi:MAG: hypothetical protein F4114_18105 [Rhodospirillaceae bacterium]|nr:hypothetical protein [Rhodospirillaceae bacterium]MYB13278.1 hypothetical protein [Rhodospirillaceae bacterium]MYI50983.1 hypothetical protein [Rhodospirillaceae bacterium]
MTEAVLLKIGYIVGAVIVYGLLRWRIMAVTHEFRVRAGCDTDRLVAGGGIPADMQRALQGWADRMYQPTTPWLIVLGMLIAVLMPYQQLGRKYDAMMRSLPSEIREEVARLNVRLVFAAVTTSPLASLATFLILVVGLIVRRSVESLKRQIEALVGAYPLAFARAPLGA